MKNCSGARLAKCRSSRIAVGNLWIAWWTYLWTLTSYRQISCRAFMHSDQSSYVRVKTAISSACVWVIVLSSSNTTVSCSRLTLIAEKRSRTSVFGLPISVYVVMLLMLVYSRHRLVVVRHVGACFLLGVLLPKPLLNAQFHSRRKMVVVECRQPRVRRKYRRNSQVVPPVQKSDELVILCQTFVSFMFVVFIFSLFDSCSNWQLISY